MFKYLLLTIALLFSFNATADLPFQPTFNWTAPTAYTDGSGLDPATDLSGYNLKCTGEAVSITNTVLPNDAITWTAPLGVFTAGDYTCVMSALDTGGLESVDSSPVNFIVSQKLPNPVVTFGVK